MTRSINLTRVELNLPKCRWNPFKMHKDAIFMRFKLKKTTTKWYTKYNTSPNNERNYKKKANSKSGIKYQPLVFGCSETIWKVKTSNRVLWGQYILLFHEDTENKTTWSVLWIAATCTIFTRFSSMLLFPAVEPKEMPRWTNEDVLIEANTFCS